MSRPTVLVLDFGSQTTQLIARRIREARVYSEIHPWSMPFDAVRALDPRAIVLSGGPASVYGDNAPSLDRRILDLGVPILGICYGTQLLSHLLGGKVEPAHAREYGAASMHVTSSTGILSRFECGAEVDVWMSHGDKITALPDGFETLARTESTPFCAIGHVGRRIFGVQFHPEVVHTPRGGELIAAFLFEVAGLEPTFTPAAFADEAIASVKSTVGPEARAVCGLSGGVDSSVAAVLCHRALGDRLTCLFVDNGLLREGEAEEVIATFRETMHLKVVHVDARARFLEALHGMVDPEEKRKTIGRVFIEVFEAEAQKLAVHGEEPRFLVQGTLYPDVIESVSAKGPSAMIKSHHNVGGLPQRMRLALIEPLRELFKDEVRAMGEALGIPRDLLARHPFPGPGLAIRCLGPLTEERLTALRRADAIVTSEIKQAGLYSAIWQAFAVLLPVRSVGVMGDARTYDETCAVRAVTSTDGMTADWAVIPHEILARISNRIINSVPGINRVVYDISSKPPATIEWE